MRRERHLNLKGSIAQQRPHSLQAAESTRPKGDGRRSTTPFK